MDRSESPPSLLFADLLGAKKIWMNEGAHGAATAFERFAENVESALESVEYEGVLSAAVESDSAAILCDSGLSAARVGIAMYQPSFFRASVETERVRRTWIRGVICAAAKVRDVDALRTVEERGEAGVFKVASLSPVLLDAVSMEKSGYRGMRLLIHRGLLSRADRYALRDELQCAPLLPVRRLEFSSYPERMEEYEDVFWMASSDDALWARRRRRMATRMRRSARDADEIQQAAATQVVFDECGEILESARARRAAKNSARPAAKAVRKKSSVR